MTDQASIFPGKADAAPEAGKDPIRVMIEITENKNLSDADKSALIKCAQARFRNRRRMAYISLYTIIASLALLFAAAFFDGFGACPAGQTCDGILKSIENSQTLITWIEGFLATIVAAYFGVSAWRPAS